MSSSQKLQSEIYSLFNKLTWRRRFSLLLDSEEEAEMKTHRDAGLKTQFRNREREERVADVLVSARHRQRRRGVFLQSELRKMPLIARDVKDIVTAGDTKEHQSIHHFKHTQI